MPMLAEKILVATDFSDCAGWAYECARRLAVDCAAQLDVVHVLEAYAGMDPEFPVNRLYLDHLRKEAEPPLNQLVQQADRSGLKVAGHRVIGVPSEEIINLSRQLGTDLIVLGTHGRTGMERILLGSTAERVVIGAPCPVLTVRQQGSKPGFRSILAPVDFSDCSLDALEYAVRVAKQFGASLTVLHVMEPVTYGLDFTLTQPLEGRQLRTSLESQLSKLIQPLTAQGLTVHSVVRGGSPADSILNWSRTDHYDLIVMGTHGRRGISHVLAGSVAQAVLRRAPCPVLTVKSPKFSRNSR